MASVEKSVFTKRYEIFLSQLRRERGEAGLRQIDLAQRLIAFSGHSDSNVTLLESEKLERALQRFVSRCETGERRVDIAELWVLCRALDISFREFTANLDGLFLESELNIVSEPLDEN